MPQQQYDLAHQQENGLGLAGFIVSLIGLISCGILSPIGLIMSWIAKSREPKGLAIAGVVLGLVGSAELILFLALGVFGMILAALGLAAGAGRP
ncbi:MAG: hypothetical protein H7Y88_07400 [Phycisphaerales bacterium]|nr:hypothetical protein [Phycisphaerales bacterium]